MNILPNNWNFFNNMASYTPLIATKQNLKCKIERGKTTSEWLNVHDTY
jgi:hypothetical protein